MSSSSSIPMVAPTPTVALSASQITSVMSTLEPLLKDKSLSQVLANMPVIVETSYGLVQSALTSNPSQISSTVVTLIQSTLALSPFPAADVTVLDAVVADLVPALVTMVVKYLPEVEEEVESGCSACCAWLKSHLSCC